MGQHDRQGNIDFWGQWIKRGTKLEFNYVSGEEHNIATEQLPSLIRGATCSIRTSAKAKLQIYLKIRFWDSAMVHLWYQTSLYVEPGWWLVLIWS